MSTIGRVLSSAEVDERDRIDTILEQIRAAGGRATTPRRAILAVLVDHRHAHPSAEHIVTSVRRRHPEIADSTVYRFLDELERIGAVRPVALGSGPSRYHFADESEHHHLACRRCGNITELPARIVAQVRALIRDDGGFEADLHHMTVVGRCRTCQSTDDDMTENVQLGEHTHDH